MSNLNQIFKFINGFALSLFHRGTSIIKVPQQNFAATSILFHYIEDKSTEAWKRKMIREAQSDGDDSRTEYLKGFHSKKKPISPEVSSFFDHFPNVRDFRWDLRIMKQFYMNIKKHFLFHDQRYIDQRVEILGYDLAAAHFIVHRGGRVRFKGTGDWVMKNKDYNYKLPSRYSPHFLIEALDASGVLIIYDGLQNIENLYHLKWLSFAGCPNFNDWCIDRLCDQNYKCLIHLDISHCSLLTESGITTLAKLNTLNSLNVSGLNHMRNLKLICLLLQDAIPNLTIEGLVDESGEPLKLHAQQSIT